jgi:hypothetical protein
LSSPILSGTARRQINPKLHRNRMFFWRADFARKRQLPDKGPHFKVSEHLALSGEMRPANR